MFQHHYIAVLIILARKIFQTWSGTKCLSIVCINIFCLIQKLINFSILVGDNYVILKTVIIRLLLMMIIIASCYIHDSECLHYCCSLVNNSEYVDRGQA